MPDQVESKLRILIVHLGWLQLLICRGRGLRPLMRKIICNKKNYYNNAVRLSGFILLTDTQKESQLLSFDLTNRMETTQPIFT